MRNLALIASVTMAALSLATARAQDNSLPALIVAPFSGDRTHIQYWQPALGEGLAEMLITELGKINKFTVLETTALDVLKDEIRQGEDGWIEASEKIEKGGFAAADFMFTAKVTRFGHKESKVNLGGFVPRNFGNLGVKSTTSDVRIDWRLVDANNRRVIKTGSATSEQKGTGFDVGVNIGGSGGTIGFDNKEFMNSALGRATVAALAQITAELSPLSLPPSSRSKSKVSQAAKAAEEIKAAADGLRRTPGKVLAAVNAETVIVSLGSKHGFKDGDTLNLYELNEIKDEKGEVVFAEEKLVGEVVLQAVQEERSRAAYKGEQKVKAGWLVKAK
jgi:curli biogenesis system outer membrane secretion channel CsgG